MQATLAVALCPDAICSGSIQQTHVRSQINARSAMITSSRLLPHIVPPVPIGVQLRPCFGATAESLPALARSSEGWGRSSLPRCFFFALLFAGVSKSRFLRYRFFFAGVSNRRPLFSPAPSCCAANCQCQVLTPKLFRWAPPSTEGVDTQQRALYSKAGCSSRKEPDVYPSSGSLAIFMPKAYR